MKNCRRHPLTDFHGRKRLTRGSLLQNRRAVERKSVVCNVTCRSAPNQPARPLLLLSVVLQILLAFGHFGGSSSFVVWLPGRPFSRASIRTLVGLRAGCLTRSEGDGRCQLRVGVKHRGRDAVVQRGLGIALLAVRRPLRSRRVPLRQVRCDDSLGCYAALRWAAASLRFCS